MPCSRRCLLFTAALFLTILDGPAWAGGDELSTGWTRFRGPGGHGVVEGASLPDRITEQDFAWHITLPGGGHSSPVVFGESIYLTWIDDNTRRRSLGRINKMDGAIRWTFEDEFTEYEHHRDNSFASSTPTVDARGVYCYWSSGDKQILIAVNHDGELMWRKTIGTFSAEWGTGSSPVLAGGVLIVANDNEGEKSFLAGLDPATGEELWRRDRTSTRSSYATPMDLQSESGELLMIFASTSHGLTCLDPRDGSLQWEIDGLFKQRCVGSPVLAGDLIYQCAGSGNSGKEAYAIAPPRTGERSAPAIQHEITGGLPYVPTPIAVGPHVFFWTDSGILSCLEASTGEVLWKQRIGDRFYGSPICIDNRLYNLSRDGNLHVIEASPTFQPLYTLELGEGSSASPGYADGTLLLRTERHLIAVRSGAGE